MDMVVLSVGMEPSAGTKSVAQLLEIPQNKYGFIEVANPPLDTVSTKRPGVFAAGAALGPADLEDTISSAAAAAVKAATVARKSSLAPA